MQVVELARKSREELDSFQQRQAASDDEDDEALATPARRRTAKRRAAKLAEKLEAAAADQLTQLRLACIHPQARGCLAPGVGVGTALAALPRTAHAPVVACSAACRRPSCCPARS